MINEFNVKKIILSDASLCSQWLILSVIITQFYTVMSLKT